MATVEIVFTNKPEGKVFAQTSWRVVASGRNPDVAVEGPFDTAAQTHQARH